VLEFLSEYGLFLAKVVTVVVALLIIMASMVGVSMKSHKKKKGEIVVTHLNHSIESMRDAIMHVVLDKEAAKLQHKADKKQLKEEKKEKKKAKKNKTEQTEDKKRVFVLNFDGDIKASAVASLKHEVTAILSLAGEKDEVLVRLESGGGMVHAYGLAASQLYRLKQKNVSLTICVDKVAASGGYMMACLADKLIAAPFAVIGSIGVVAQLPNFNRLMKHNKVDFEMITAGEYKRTLTMFGENTEKGRQKMHDDIEDLHSLFKSFVKDHRQQLDIEDVATGETWFGIKALEKNLVDEIKTSDECIVEACENADVYEVCYEEKKSITDRFGSMLHTVIDGVLLSWLQRSQNSRFYS